MRYVVGTLLVALLAILQSSVLARFPFLEGTPSLILLAVVSWSLVGRAAEAMILGFVGGLFLDMLSGGPFGISSIALVAAAYLASLTEGRFWEAHILAPLGVMAGASVVYYAITTVAVWIAGHPLAPDLAFAQVFLPSTFLNVLLSLPSVQIAGRLQEAAFPPAVRMG